MMYMREPRGEVPVTPVPGAGLAIAICVLLRFTSECCRGACSIMRLDSARQFVERYGAPGTGAVSAIGPSL